VGIGGAGLSAYANFARAWGAEVRGWDARDTIFLEAVKGVDVDVGGEPEPPDGFEVVVSAAHAGRLEGRSRAEFLAELVALRRSIVVGERTARPRRQVGTSFREPGRSRGSSAKSPTRRKCRHGRGLPGRGATSPTADDPLGAEIAVVTNIS
jgi:hypothetical protein